MPLRIIAPSSSIVGGPTSSLPVAAFTFTNSGQAYFFNASASTGQAPLTYAWTFGDTGTGTGVSPGHTYSVTGSVTVVLTVHDAALNVATTSQTFNVGSGPPPPPPGSMMPRIGEDITTVTSSGISAEEAIVGRMNVFRSYDSGWTQNFKTEPAWTTGMASRSDCQVWQTFKPNVASFASGSLNSACDAYLATFPNVGMLTDIRGNQYPKYIIDLWHEPFPHNNIAPSDFIAMTLNLANRIAATGRTDMWCGVNYQDLNMPIKSGAAAGTTNSADNLVSTAMRGLVKFVGVDYYCADGVYAPVSSSFKPPNRQTTIVSDMTACEAWVDNHLPGAILGMPELGCGDLNPSPGPTKDIWLTTLYNHGVSSQRWNGFVYFDKGAYPLNSTIEGAASVASWKALAGRAFT